MHKTHTHPPRTSVSTTLLLVIRRKSRYIFDIRYIANARKWVCVCCSIVCALIYLRKSYGKFMTKSSPAEYLSFRNRLKIYVCTRLKWLKSFDRCHSQICMSILWKFSPKTAYRHTNSHTIENNYSCEMNFICISVENFRRLNEIYMVLYQNGCYTYTSDNVCHGWR